MVVTATKHRMRMIAPQADLMPIPTINTTPLIDMMLVILIMLIVSIPVTTHKVPLDLPTSQPVPRTPPVHRLAILASGALSWDGQPLPAEALAARLAAFQADPSMPVLELNAEAEARYERFDQIIGQVRRAGITRLGFMGNEGYAAALDR